MINSLSLVQANMDKNAMQLNHAAASNNSASVMESKKEIGLDLANTIKASSLHKLSFSGSTADLIEVNPAMKQQALDRVKKALSPKAVMVIGASSNYDKEKGPGLGTLALSNIVNSKFAGATYAINPKGVVVIDKNKDPIKFNGEAVIPAGTAVKLDDRGRSFVPAMPGEKDGVLIIRKNADEVISDMQQKGIDNENKLGVFVAKAEPKNVKNGIESFAKMGADGVNIIAAGFSEVGERGKAASNALREAFNEAPEGMAIIGPNTIGVVNTDPNVRLNATFMAPTSKFAPDKRTAFVSASGAMLVALGNERLPAKYAISGGNGEVLGLNDIITNFKDDKDIEVVTSYMENLGNAKDFAKGLKAMCKEKSVIIHKSGRTAAAQAAAAAHTGAAASGYGAVELLLKENGVIVSDKSRDLGIYTVAMSNLADKADGSGKILPKGRDLAIVTNGGGAGSLMTDAVETEGVVAKDGFMKMATLDKENTIPVLQGQKPVDEKTMKALAEAGITSEDDNMLNLPKDCAAFSNPNPSTLDTIADILPAEYLKSAGALLDDKNLNGMMAYLVPLNKNLGREIEIIDGLAALQQAHEKPVVAVIQGDDETMAKLDAHIKENDLRIAVYRTPEDADQAMSAMVRRHEWLEEQKAIETAKTTEKPLTGINKSEAQSIINNAKTAGLKKLDGQQAQDVLEAYGVRVCQSKAVSMVSDKEEMVQSVVKAASQIMEDTKAPVVLKIMSDHKEIGGHKSNIGGVLLNLKDAKSVEEGVKQIYENIIDPGKVTIDGKEVSTAGQIKGIQVQEMVLGNDAQEIFVGTNVDEGSGIATMTLGEGGILVDHHADSQVTMLLPEEGDPVKYKADKLLTMSPGGKSKNPVGGHFDAEHPVRAGLPVGDKDKMVEQLARIAKFANDFKDVVESVNVNPFKIVKSGPNKGEVVCVDAKVTFKK